MLSLKEIQYVKVLFPSIERALTLPLASPCRLPSHSRSLKSGIKSISAFLRMNMNIFPILFYTGKPLQITKFIFFSDSHVPTEGQLGFCRTGKCLSSNGKNITKELKIIIHQSKYNQIFQTSTIWEEELGWEGGTVQQMQTFGQLSSSMEDLLSCDKLPPCTCQAKPSG